MFLKSILAAFSLFCLVCHAQTVWDNLNNNYSNYSTFISLAETSGLDTFLSNTQNITVVAPTDDAFSSLPPIILNLLQLSSFSTITRSLLLYHVVQGAFTTQNVTANMTEYATSYLSAIPLSVYRVNETVFVNEAAIVQPDLVGTNGVVQGIDRILNPSFALSPAISNPYLVPFDAISLISLLPPYDTNLIVTPFMGSYCTCQ